MSAVVNDFRRTWDKEKFEKKAKERKYKVDEEEDAYEEDLTPEEREEFEKNNKKEPEVKPRSNLKARDYKIDLHARLGKTVLISQTTPTSQADGFYCDVCDCIIKDSINYLDHINGKRHQKNLGMNMKVERSTLEQVRERINWHKQNLETQKKKYDIQERMKEIKEEEEKLKEYRKEKRKEKKLRKKGLNELDDEQNDDMMKLMGFSGFNTSKK